MADVLAGLHLDGHISREVGPASHDLGRIVSRTPRAIVRAASPSDVIAVARHCSAHRVPLAVRGSGHTTHGQAQSDGVVLDLSALSTTITWRDTSALVPAGLRWRDAVLPAIARGRTFPVLTDYLGLTVGGTLSSAGIGEATFARGVQTDHLRALEVVTGEGALATCSPTRERELFDAVRAGMGQCAIILTAELETAPAPRTVSLRKLRFASCEALLRAHRMLADSGVEYLQGSLDVSPIGKRTFTLNAAHSDQCRPESPSDDSLGALPGGSAPQVFTFVDFVERVATFELAMHQLNVWHLSHPWAFLLVPVDHADAFMRAIAGLLRTTRDGRLVTYLVRRAQCHTPNLMLPDADESFLFGVLHNSEPSAVARVLASNQQLADAVLAIGGRVYPVGSVPMSRTAWRLQLGARWDALDRAKRRYDPAKVLAPGVGMFT